MPQNDIRNIEYVFSRRVYERVLRQDISPLTALQQLNHTVSGKVVAAQIHSDGPIQHEPHVALKLEEWEDCQQCPEYRCCYDLSNAKLAMEQALYRIG